MVPGGLRVRRRRRRQNDGGGESCGGARYKKRTSVGWEEEGSKKDGGRTGGRVRADPSIAAVFAEGAAEFRATSEVRRYIIIMYMYVFARLLRGAAARAAGRNGGGEGGSWEA